jgi:hypothetical protein
MPIDHSFLTRHNNTLLRNDYLIGCAAKIAVRSKHDLPHEYRRWASCSSQWRATSGPPAGLIEYVDADVE